MVNSFIRPSITGTIIPKMGFRLEMPAAMEQLSWFGRGPWDNYRDRKEASLPAIYMSTVTDQHEDYILPQEHGTKQDVRWMSLSNSEGKGLLFVAPDQMAASAVHFRPEDNYTSNGNRMKHSYQFKTCANTVVSLDAATRGLGNASCGPDVMEKYELRAQNTAFRFFIIPLDYTSTQLLNSSAPQLARVEMPVCQPVSCERQQNGRIKMTTDTKNATIWYSINGAEYKKYTAMISHDGACTIRAYSTAEGLLASPVMTYDFTLFINKSTWKLVSVDSQHSGNEATKAFDGKNDTFWHTEYWGSEPPCPHTLIVDMGTTYKVTAFTYLARQDGEVNGMVKGYEFYLSDDGKTWGTAVTTGEFKNTKSLQEAKLKTPVTGRYWKFVAKSEINGKAWTSAAEIGIQALADDTAIQEATTENAIHDDSVYNLQGHKMTGNEASWPHGIYIFRGRKILR
jgi:beta-galactosidase